MGSPSTSAAIGSAGSSAAAGHPWASCPGSMSWRPARPVTGARGHGQEVRAGGVAEVFGALPAFPADAARFAAMVADDMFLLAAAPCLLSSGGVEPLLALAFSFRAFVLALAFALRPAGADSANLHGGSAAGARSEGLLRDRRGADPLVDLSVCGETRGLEQEMLFDIRSRRRRCTNLTTWSGAESTAGGSSLWTWSSLTAPEAAMASASTVSMALAHAEIANRKPRQLVSRSRKDFGRPTAEGNRTPAPSPRIKRKLQQQTSTWIDAAETKQKTLVAPPPSRRSPSANRAAEFLQGPRHTKTADQRTNSGPQHFDTVLYKAAVFATTLATCACALGVLSPRYADPTSFSVWLVCGSKPGRSNNI